MRNKKVSSGISLFFVLMVWGSQSFPFEKPTHQTINENIAKRLINGFSLNDYLLKQLGLLKGIDEPLEIGSDEKTVQKWLGEGGDKEDEPEGPLRYPTNTARNNRHFHNPIKSWNNAGLNTIIFTAQSLLLWAQNPNQDPGGQWSWKDARYYFYKGLTFNVKTGRDLYFAETFRALGQQMHLVQDVSVPAHVRNDIHIIPAYEVYVENIRKSNRNIWARWIDNPISYNKSILDIPPNHPSAPCPISRIVDTDLYQEYNPNITRTFPNFPQAIGLAEYTNANFLSEDTMFTEYFDPNHRHYFPYPRTFSTILWPDGINFFPFTRKYLKKTGEGDDVDHLATVSFLYLYRQRYFPQYKMFLPVGLDDKCYEESASKLIPRAVGYSAGLLKYFFRGKIEITDPIIEGFSDQGYTRVTLKAQNTTPDDEEMTGGDNASIKLVVKLKIPSEEDYFYIVASEANDIKSIPRNEPVELTFDLSQTPLPIDASDIYLQVVYRGNLGLEQDSVAVGFEPFDCCQKDPEKRKVELWWESTRNTTCHEPDKYPPMNYGSTTICKVPPLIDLYQLYQYSQFDGGNFYIMPEIKGCCFPFTWTLQGPGELTPNNDGSSAHYKLPDDAYTNYQCAPVTIRVKDKCGTTDQVVADCCQINNTLKIAYSSLVMGCGQFQDLYNSGGCPPYSWSLGGGGTLVVDSSFPDHRKATYTSPATNPNCANNPTITLTDCCGKSATLKLAINCYTSQGVAYRFCDKLSCAHQCLFDGGICHFHATFGVWRYNCDGTAWGTPEFFDGSGGIYSFTCRQPSSTQLMCGGYSQSTCSYENSGWDNPCGGSGWGACANPSQRCGNYMDLRTQQMKNQGCCPVNPKTGLPF